MNTRNLSRCAVGAGLALALLVASGCGSETATDPTPAPSREDAKIVTDPNPIQVCDDSGLGATTVSWEAERATVIEIRIGTPDGALLARMGPRGSAATGDWIADGTVIYLQDVSDDQPPTPESTLAAVEVTVTDLNCP